MLIDVSKKSIPRVKCKTSEKAPTTKSNNINQETKQKEYHQSKRIDLLNKNCKEYPSQDLKLKPQQMNPKKIRASQNRNFTKKNIFENLEDMESEEKEKPTQKKIPYYQ